MRSDLGAAQNHPNGKLFGALNEIVPSGELRSSVAHSAVDEILWMDINAASFRTQPMRNPVPMTLPVDVSMSNETIADQGYVFVLFI